MDIVERLKPIIVELERVKHNVLIVSHRAVIRTLLAYFQEIPLEQVPHLDVPLNQVIRLQPTAYGVEIQKFDLSGRVEEIMKEGSSKRQKTDGSFHE